jgi:hypothetical protein
MSAPVTNGCQAAGGRLWLGSCSEKSGCITKAGRICAQCHIIFRYSPSRSSTTSVRQGNKQHHLRRLKIQMIPIFTDPRNMRENCPHNFWCCRSSFHRELANKNLNGDIYMAPPKPLWLASEISCPAHTDVNIIVPEILSGVTAATKS